MIDTASIWNRTKENTQSEMIQKRAVFVPANMTPSIQTSLMSARKASERREIYGSNRSPHLMTIPSFKYYLENT